MGGVKEYLGDSGWFVPVEGGEHFRYIGQGKVTTQEIKSEIK